MTLIFPVNAPVNFITLFAHSAEVRVTSVEPATFLTSWVKAKVMECPIPTVYQWAEEPEEKNIAASLGASTKEAAPSIVSPPDGVTVIEPAPPFLAMKKKSAPIEEAVGSVQVIEPDVQTTV